MRLRGWLAALAAIAAIALAGYLGVAARLWTHAAERLAHPPTRPADVALVLGNRAWLHGAPNPCLTGRVDRGIALVQGGWARRLMMSGGTDREDGRNEAEVMRKHAQGAGYGGPVLMEVESQSTRENLIKSLPILRQAGVTSLIVVSDPYHLWRIERLARATGFDREFDVQYAGAPTSCWQRWGMLYRGALREPLAVVNNGLHGYLH